MWSLGTGGEVVSATPILHRIPVEDFLKTQKRYAHLFAPQRREDAIARLQAAADRNIQRFGLLPAEPSGHSRRPDPEEGP